MKNDYETIPSGTNSKAVYGNFTVSSNTTQTITHGLGYAPSLIQIDFAYWLGATGSSETSGISSGKVQYDGTTINQYCNYGYSSLGSSGIAIFQRLLNFCAHAEVSSSGVSANRELQISNITSTTFDVTSTGTGSGGLTITFDYVAQ